jgi:hypothetical protein
MRVDWAIPCRYAEVNGPLTTIVGAPSNTFYVPDLPAAIGCPVAIRIVATEDELGDEHVVRMDLMGPDLGSLGELSVSFTPDGLAEDREPGWEIGTMSVQVIQWEAEQEGAYTLNVYLDDRHAKTVTFLVRLGPPPPQ